MADERALLEEFKPLLRYDSNEGYFADSAAEMTDAAGIVLRSATGETIAEPGAGEHDLSLGFLAPAGRRYPNDVLVSEGDRLSVATRDYKKLYRAIRVREGYPNVIYGRLVERDGVRWLQYWFWFFYNDLRALAIGLGLHEGDWEGIQLRMGANGPDLAVYAQHGYAEARKWPRVKTQGRRPVVYVAQGSHASYFDDGMPVTHWHQTEHFLDRADGKVTPKRELRLEPLSDPAPGWALWPGRWGDTQKPTTGPSWYRQISSGSPTGPGQKRHWKDPASLLRRAEEVGRAPGRRAPAPARAPQPPAPPSFTPREEDGKLQLEYDLAPAAGPRPAQALLVTVNSPDDPYPPTTYTLSVAADAGSVRVPLEVDRGRRYEVTASALTQEGALSEPVREQLQPASAGADPAP